MYEIAVTAPVPGTLRYSHPDSSPAFVIGHAVLVPLGRRKVTGYILDVFADEEKGAEEYVIKPVERLLAWEPFFPKEMVQLYRWLAEYYHHPIGAVLRTALPAASTAASGFFARLTAEGGERIPSFLDSAKPFQAELVRLQERRHLTPTAVARLRRSPAGTKLLEQLESEQIIELQAGVFRSGTNGKFQVVYEPTQALAELLHREDAPDATALGAWAQEQTGQSLQPAALKTLGIVSELYRSSEQKQIPKKAVQTRYKNSGRYLKILVAQNLLVQTKKRMYRTPFGEQVVPVKTTPKTLTTEQRQVLGEIHIAIEKNAFHPLLLHGVTGCGKTEVYLQAVQKVLAAGKNALVLVPEIALATQMEEQFHALFGHLLALLHSGLTQGQRLDQWHAVRQGKIRVVLGARSAVFAPLDNLGIIVVDEEHESAYKQDDGLRYHGRDVAVMRAKMAECPVILGSATPSITSYANTQNGKYTLLSMGSRVSNRPLPKVRIVDLSRGKRSRPDLFFSDQLIRAMHETLDRREQILLFVNKRGYSSSMICQDCGSIVQCRHCQVSMTRHETKQVLLCHYCGFTLPLKVQCRHCHSDGVIGIGLGSERIEKEAEQLFPHASIARLDSDTASNRKQYLATLARVRQQKVDILVGTQMIAKGLHFPGITLVGVILADSGLALPDYKASERVFSLLSQVTGRAGRGERPGSVIIQTYQPHHHAITCAQAHDYRGLVDKELPVRSQLNFPPFGRLVNIMLRGRNEKTVEKAALAVSDFLQQHFATQLRQRQVEQLGPAPAPLSRVKNQYRWQLLLKSCNYKLLHPMVTALQKERCFQSGGIRCSIDIDPENML